MKLYDIKPKLSLEEVSLLGRMFDKLKSNVADIGENILIDMKYYDGLFDFLVEFKNKLSQIEGDSNIEIRNSDIPNNLREAFGFRDSINIETIEQLMEDHKLLLETTNKHFKAMVEVTNYFLHTEFKKSVKSPRFLLDDKHNHINRARANKSIILLGGRTIKFDKAGNSILDYNGKKDPIYITQREDIHDIIDLKIPTKNDLINLIDTIKKTIIFFSDNNKEISKDSDFIIDHLPNLGEKQQSETDNKWSGELEISLQDIGKFAYNLTDWHGKFNSLNVDLIKKLIAYLKFCISHYH